MSTLAVTLTTAELAALVREAVRAELSGGQSPAPAPAPRAVVPERAPGVAALGGTEMDQNHEAARLADRLRDELEGTRLLLERERERVRAIGLQNAPLSQVLDTLRFKLFVCGPWRSRALSRLAAARAALECETEDDVPAAASRVRRERDEAIRLLHMLDRADCRHPDVAAFLDGLGVEDVRP